ncbi:DUF1329 domain-containing protein [Pseudomonas stutzeri]|uniref:DUF1329 domain-containing protein n=1 Tax=Stutzerimonas stutzeri TaxID=316 RepID=UPI00210D042F|nr:DUF1329 domain-containing protein [Stutzerimonas stutzeri]MCQ4310312.1 DUF1329 domain-containing protein [Stutzerimonas stutzeri]
MKQCTHLLRGGLLLTALTLAHAVSAANDTPTLGELTPIGAERAGNADGSIPAWKGGLDKNAGTLADNGAPSNPFADEQLLFKITAQNYKQYQDKLSPGLIAMLNRYPETFYLPIYPSHRTVAVTGSTVKSVEHNLASARLVNDGNGLENFEGSIAFPKPKSGLEVMWNHITRYRKGSFKLTTDSVAPEPKGDFSVVTTEQRFTLAEHLTGYEPGDADDVLFFYSHRITAPARKAGEVVLVHETVDQVDDPRRSWIYSSGQRRVRRAPNTAYDAAGPTTAGLRTADSRDMFNGAPDRYDWKLVGKRELYIPYNSYELASPTHKYDEFIKAGHVDPSVTRYELHRVWEVEATLKPGKRHIYSKRHYFIDEDTWAIVEADHYDSRGELWRVGENHGYFHYGVQAPLIAMEVFYDLQSRRYIASGLTNEQPKPYDFSYRASASDYSPGALRSAGLR